jgi:4-alpha-glucanotransferase
MTERKSGILLHISSLPGIYGIGTLGSEAYDFIDFLISINHSLWQILPLGPTGYGDSPYQCFSAFAGNPLLISLEKLVDYGYLDKKEILLDEKVDTHTVDYGYLYEKKYPVLWSAFKNFSLNKERDFFDFCEKNSFWLDDYAIFMAIKKVYPVAWYQWDENLKRKKELDIEKIYPAAKEVVDFYKFLQYCFFRQWKELKSYANGKGVQIIGDIPIFVAMDSSDVWANPEFFEIDENLRPIRVAGVPPDYFSATGQLWGNPLYRWEKLKENNYEWWIKRFIIAFEMYDFVRIDHFRGFCGYWAIPYGEKTAINGKWECGPGSELFDTLSSMFKNPPVIAEDLGLITEDVVNLREKYNFPGMKVLQFGFEDGPLSEHLPHNYHNANFVVYSGTHDNDTLSGWLKHLDEKKKSFLLSYLGMKGIKDEKEICKKIVRLAYSSVAKFAIIPLQDLLFLDSSARMNTPGTLGNNWRWKLSKGQIEKSDFDWVKEFVLLYNRKS